MRGLFGEGCFRQVAAPFRGLAVGHGARPGVHVDDREPQPPGKSHHVAVEAPGGLEFGQGVRGPGRVRASRRRGRPPGGRVPRFWGP
eukprot:9829723-Lingulodinium_polyedra.AAC.1